MINITHSLRVRYGETDPMKYVYYGNYAEYLEVARVELFRAIGISYNEIEKRGIWLPVSVSAQQNMMTCSISIPKSQKNLPQK